jgi:undecaprenyl-diphosphatase
MTMSRNYFRTAIVTGCVSMVSALILGIAATGGHLSVIDRPLFKAMALTRAQSTDGMIELARTLSALGAGSNTAVLLIAALAWLAWKRCWQAAMMLLVIRGSCAFMIDALKELYGRPRPALVPPLEYVSNLSFPSGHAGNNAALIGFLVFLLTRNRAWRLAALTLIGGIGVSRIMLGVHWPSDVVGGWLFGGGIAAIGLALTRRMEAMR